MSILKDVSSIEAIVVGSRQAAERLLSGEVDAAGFHAGDLDVRRVAPFEMLFRGGRYVVQPLFSASRD